MGKSSHIAGYSGLGLQFQLFWRLREEFKGNTDSTVRPFQTQTLNKQKTVNGVQYSTT